MNDVEKSSLLQDKGQDASDDIECVNLSPVKNLAHGTSNSSMVGSHHRDNSNDVGMGELAQGLKSRKRYIFYIVFFVMFVIEVYTLNRVNRIEKDNSSTKNSVNSVADGVDELTQHIRVNTLANGVVSLDLQVDEIRMPKAKENIVISEVTVSGVRRWDVPLYKAYVGDVVSWTWTTNENIISCDSNLDIIVDNPVLNSGNLMVSGQYSFTFDLAGTYYYTSQNSAGLSGAVVIADYPALTAGEVVRGPITTVPEGFVDNFDITVLQSDGCWKQCLNSKTNNENNKYSTAGIDAVFTDCDGDWIFMAQTTSTASSQIVKGAFGNKANILNSNQYSLETTSNGVITRSSTVYDNGVYWYNYQFKLNSAIANSISLSTADTLGFYYGVGYIALNSYVDCSKTVSWAYNNHVTYWGQDFMLVCTTIDGNGYETIGTSAKTTQYLYTSVPTCAVIPDSSDIFQEHSSNTTMSPSPVHGRDDD